MRSLLPRLAAVLTLALGIFVGLIAPSAAAGTYDPVRHAYDAPSTQSVQNNRVLSRLGPSIDVVAAHGGRPALASSGGVAANGARVAPSPTGTSSVSSPIFVGFTDGPPAIVPQGAVGPTLTRGTGVQYTGGSGGLGLHPNASGVRIMDQTAHHGPRVVYMNRTGQTINPVTGRTVANSDPWAHLPW